MSKIKVRKSDQNEGFKYPVFDYRPDWPYISIGFGDEKDYFIENLSLLLASGMSILSALDSIGESVKSKKMKKVTKFITESINDGLPFWKSVDSARIFPKRIIALIQSGEEAGRLPDHLNLATAQLHKEKVFKSRLKSALIYPGIVLTLAFIIALGAFWYILPNLVFLFDITEKTLPFSTQVLLWVGVFFESYGYIFIPSLILTLFIIIYVFFFNKRTKFLGDFFLLRLPGIKRLIQGVEMARFGYTFGALLQSGFQINESLELVKSGTDYVSYQRFYSHLQEKINQGNSFKKSLDSYPKSDRYIKIPIQQLIMAAERSGRLPETLIKIGVIFEEKTDAMSKDLGTIIEPVILIIVGFVVGFVVLGIISPIYDVSF